MTEPSARVLTRPDEVAAALPGLARVYRAAFGAYGEGDDELRRFADEQLPKHGQWILTFLESTATDGARPSRVALARIYGLGLGVEPDMAKAKGFLKGLPKDEAKALLDDITAVASQS